MSFTFRPAKRESVGLLIGLAGGTGSGKTYSAMRLATGLANGPRFVVIDTEAGRAKHYADEFQFDHGDLGAPFRPDAYAEAIIAADEAGYPVIVVDSASHEHAGDGGLLDWHEEEFERLGGRDAVKMTAWIKPKMAHRKFVSRLLQVRAHVILCFRAEEKIEIAKEDGKTVVRPKRGLTGLDGWMPISEKSLPYELTLSFLLTADAPGLPKPIKLQEQHRAFVPLDQPISEETGRHLGEWARGESAPVATKSLATDSEVVALNKELLDLVTQLDATDALPKIAEKTATGDKAWLKRQITTAKKTLADRPAPDGEEGYFESRIPESARTSG